MSAPVVSKHCLTSAARQSTQQPYLAAAFSNEEGTGVLSSAMLAASITKEASKQTYYTIRYLVDRPLVSDAYRAYAYFRWVDDTLDQGRLAKQERLAFLARQQRIINRCYGGKRPPDLRPEEALVADLIRGDQRESGGLHTYISQMMAVMAFDAGRKGRPISQAELDEYTQGLAMAVTEALHYFIGHNCASPQDDGRYLAVMGAHITHMLRDAIEDAAVGYYNIPQEFLEANRIDPTDVDGDAARAWVRSQVKLARDHFAAGKAYLARVENLRCRIAGYAYIARFEIVLDAIEEDNYRLRSAYPERKSPGARLKMALTGLAQAISPGARCDMAPGNNSPATGSIFYEGLAR
jgi:phytoene/squalene synthetase